MFPELHWRGRRVLVSVPGVNYCWFTGVAKPWQNVLHQRPGTQQGHSTRSGTGGTSIVSPSDSSRVLDRKFPCPNCTSVFSRKGGLTYHQKFECGQNPRFNCPYCSYCARHISNARRHVRKCHPGRDVYTVDLCQLQQNVAWNYTRRRFESSQPEEGGFDRKPWNIYFKRRRRVSLFILALASYIHTNFRSSSFVVVIWRNGGADRDSCKTTKV